MQGLDILIDGFDADLWANRYWLEYLKHKDGVEVDLSLLGHVLSAQSIWLARCKGDSPDRLPVIEPTEDAMASLNRDWKEFLMSTDGDPVIDYWRTTGEPFRSTVYEIALHVIDHGAYHRGELRGLCRARKDQDFPDVGRIGFSFEKAARE